MTKEITKEQIQQITQHLLEVPSKYSYVPLSILGSLKESQSPSDKENLRKGDQDAKSS